MDGGVEVDAHRAGVIQGIEVVVCIVETQLEDIFRRLCGTHYGTCQGGAGAGFVHRDEVAVGIVGGGGQFHAVASVVEDTVPLVAVGGGALGREAVGGLGKVGGEDVLSLGPEGCRSAGGHAVGGIRRVAAGQLWKSGGVLDTDDAASAVETWAGLALLHMHLDDIGPLVADNLVAASVVGTAVKGNVVPRAYNLAHGESILNAVVDAVVAGNLAVAGIGVFVDAVDGVAHQRYMIRSAGGTIRPG